ncbi:MAG TPA: FAD-dependent oxidoreductase [Chitinophagaceae bacterium]|nr:FAD-dependent oxidoreductase [Chitinophagaceae bacterium]
MAKVIIVGGGIIGLSSAFYLQQSGWDVIVIDKGNFKENCSYGNAGYISPSHFVPLASPGIVKMALKWMFNSTSPFYVKPRLNWPLISWGMQFMRSATKEHVKNSAIPLRDIGLLSMKEYEEWRNLSDFNFYFEKKGILDLFQTEEKLHHVHEVEKGARELGLDAVILKKEEVEALEPGIKMNILGGLHWKCDAHCYPNDLMKNLISYLENKNVKLVPNEEVTSFVKKNNLITKVVTNKNEYLTDAVVIATGSWSREVAGLADAKIPLMPGRGYSVTVNDDQFKTNYPAILVEGRVAITPMNGRMRFGGTMEITPTGTPPRMNRVHGILEAVKRFFPDFNIPMPAVEDVWYGYRPCSADGLPYIGRLKKNKNVIVATGHAMVGLTFGAGTGKMVSELLDERPTSMDIKAFAPERFS